MRRLPVLCAVVVLILAAVITTRSMIVRAAGQLANDAGAATATQPTVIASNISVRSMAIDPQEPSSLYVTNASAPDQIFKIAIQDVPNSTSNGRFAAIAGTGAAGSLGDGGLATSAQLNLDENSLFERSGMGVGPDGTLYISDSGNSTIRAMAGPASTEPGVIRSVAGRWATGQNVALSDPMGIALDSTGNLFIADHAANLVAVLAASGQEKTLAHVTSPASIAVTHDGKTVFVASPETGAVFAIQTQTLAISSVGGFAPSSNAAVCGSTSSQVCPAGLAVDGSGNLFVSDANSGRILRVDAETAAVTVVASGLNTPGALSMDTKGTLYVAEQSANRIVAYAQVGTSQGGLSLTPTSGTYSNEPSGGITATQSFMLSNLTSSLITGLTIPKTTSPADFTVESNSCTTTLAANATCTLNIAFTPTTTGARSATLVVTDSNSGDSASTVLSGTGDDYQVQLANGQLMSVSIQSGASATFHLEIVPDNVFSGTVAFVCPNNLPTNTTCTFSSPTVNVTAGTPAPFSVTFQTTGIINPLNTSLPSFPFSMSGGSFLALIFAIGALLSFFWFQQNRRRWFPISGTIIGVVLLLFGCSKGVSPLAIGATPAGTSTMAVTGNSQNASRAVTVTLNVVQE